MKFGLLLHNTNNGAESLHKSLKYTHFSNQMHCLGLCELAKQLATKVLWEDGDARWRLLTQAVLTPAYDHDSAIPQWLLFKPRKCIKHCMEELHKGRALIIADAIAFVPNLARLTVTVATTKSMDCNTQKWALHEPHVFVVSYHGTARQHGQDATHGPWLGCTCQQHVTHIRPCKHMCACWVFFGANIFGAHTMPSAYFESPSMSL